MTGAHPDHDDLYRRQPRLARGVLFTLRAVAGLLGLSALALLALTFRPDPVPRHGQAALTESCVVNPCAVRITWNDGTEERGSLRLSPDQMRQDSPVEVWGRTPTPAFWARTELSTSVPGPVGPQWGLRAGFAVAAAVFLAFALSARFGTGVARRINPVGWRRARRFYGSGGQER
ncbi:hypothetical protein [Crossiella equi]|nr:hypothetical protein [Crossiella equi]